MSTIAIAYVLIITEIEKENDILKELKNVPCVTEAHLVYGVYDIVAKVETKAVQELKEVILTQIRRLTYVRSTTTMMVMEGG